MKFLFAIYLSLVAFPSSSEPADWADGSATLGYFQNNGYEEKIIFGDFTVRLEHGAWGAELGLFGTVGRYHETYAAVVYGAGVGKFSFGFPRPSYDDFATSGLTKIVPRKSLDSVGNVRSRTTYGTMYMAKYLPYGARYSSLTGLLDYTVSLHAVPNYPDVIAGGAVRLTHGLWTVDFASEAVIRGGKTEWNTKGQIVGDLGQAAIGISIFDPQANRQTVMVEVFGRFDAFDEAEITGLVRVRAKDNTVFGLGFSQRVSSRWALPVGVVGSDKNNLAASVGLRVDF